MANDGAFEEAIAAGTALAAGLFDQLAGATADPPGVTRVAYGPGERAAFALVAKAAAGWADVTFDAAGNQFITLPGRDRSRVLYVGSHLDSVPHGGNYDGAAGVILGVALQAVLAPLEPPPFDVTALCLRAEESCWFPHSYIGSKTALGRLDPAALELPRSDSGRTLAWHMRDEGFDPEAVRRGARLIDPERVVAYVEPHIEQGPVLEAAGIPLGLVTGIRGSFRFRQARCFGAYAHSGATPRALRQDAVVATAELVMAMDALWQRLERVGADLAVTFGIVGTDAQRHSFSAVAGETRFVVDVRSQSRETLDFVRDSLRAECRKIGVARQVRFELGPLSGSEPAAMSPELLQRLAAVAGSHRLMASGAGHDAATFAQAGIPAGMIFIRNANGSHNPDERMDMADFSQALALMLRAVTAWR